MNYYYDVLLNFLDTNIYFYEWDNLDNIEYYKRVPLIQVNSKTLKDFINNNIVVEKEFLDTIKILSNQDSEQSKIVGIINDFTRDNDLIYNYIIPIENNITCKYLEKLNFVWPQLDIIYIKKLIQYMIDVGFLKLN